MLVFSTTWGIKKADNQLLQCCEARAVVQRCCTQWLPRNWTRDGMCAVLKSLGSGERADFCKEVWHRVL